MVNREAAFEGWQRWEDQFIDGETIAFHSVHRGYIHMFCIKARNVRTQRLPAYRNSSLSLMSREVRSDAAGKVTMAQPSSAAYAPSRRF